MIGPDRIVARFAWAPAALAVLIVTGLGATVTATVGNAAAPAIRMTSRNQVPACVSPNRLNAFLFNEAQKRGRSVLPRFRNIANHYKHHGERFRVRWDYAFFQMVLETNFLSFRRGNGRPGDVRPSQNNFAGLGTTGGGVRGDRYPNVSTGVLAQIQHLVVYSGERLSSPVGHRTRLKQDVILRSVSRIARRRPVTFSDLARRWAADRRYGRSIQRIARLYFAGYCNNQPLRAVSQKTRKPRSQSLPPVRSPAGRAQPMFGEETRRYRTAAVPRRSLRQVAAPSNVHVRSCKVQAASYGGKRTVLIENIAGGRLHLTALQVQPGFEAAMVANYIRAYAHNGRSIGVFESPASAIAKARQICRRQTRHQPQR